MRSLFAKIFIWFWLAIMLVAGTAAVMAVWLQSGRGGEMLRWRAVTDYVLTRQGQIALEILARDGREKLREFLARSDAPDGARETFLFEDGGEELTGQAVSAAARELAARVNRTGESEVQRTENALLMATRIQNETGRQYVIVGEIPLNASEPLPSVERLAPRGFGAPFGSPGPPPDRERKSPGEPGRPAFAKGRPPPEEWRGPPPDGGFKPPPGPRGGRPFPFLGPLGAWLEQPGWLTLLLSAVVLTGGVVCYGLARYLTNPLRRLRAATQKLADGDLAARVGAAVGRRRDEIGGLGRDFDFMAGRLESLIAAQQRLLRDISHELRSPLARLNVALDIARRHAGANAHAGDALDRIERESGRLNEMIGQLLLLARLESGTPDAQKTPVDLARMLQEIAADADFEARARNCHVRITACEACAANGLPNMLRSAVENVVRNAIRHTAEGSDVELSLRRHTDETGAWALLAIRDHGPGVPEAALADIFRPFYRLDDARDRQTGGTGLGLAITERAVRAHGGRVRAANASGGGLLVEIHLPLV